MAMKANISCRFNETPSWSFSLLGINSRLAIIICIFQALFWQVKRHKRRLPKKNWHILHLRSTKKNLSHNSISKTTYSIIQLQKRKKKRKKGSYPIIPFEKKIRKEFHLFLLSLKKKKERKSYPSIHCPPAILPFHWKQEPTNSA